MELPDALIFASPAFDYGERLPDQYAKDGSDQSPPLVIANLPDAVEECVVVMDAPTVRENDRARTHWLVWGVPPADIELEAGERPDELVCGTNDFEVVGYTGPADGTTQTYRFRVFGIDTELDLESGTNPDTVLEAIESHVVSSGLIEVFYP